MKIALYLLPLFLVLQSVAQKKNPAQQFSQYITAPALKAHVYALAGDDMAGRFTASEGQRKAAAYIQQQFVRLGIPPLPGHNYQQPFTVYRDSVSYSGIQVNNNSYIKDKEFGVFTDFNHDCDLKFSEVIFAGYGIKDKNYDSYTGLDVAGKLVVLYGTEPMKNGQYHITGNKYQSHWSFPPVKAQAATRLGAAALLIIQPQFPMALYNYELGSLNLSPYKFYYGVNTFFISEKVARDIFKDKYDTILNGVANDTLPGFSLFNQQIQLRYDSEGLERQSTNVLGMVEGSDKKDEFVFITAHYDHLEKRGNNIYYGADDNASGTAAVIQLAEAFVKAKAAGHGPRRTVVFMLVSGEENGLWGSEKYTANPIFPLEKTSVNLNMDMVGRIGTGYLKDKDSINNVYIIGDDKLSTDLRPINEKSNEYVNLKMDYKYNDPKDPNFFFYRSDHYNFAKNGVPVIFYTDGDHPDYHKPSDTPDKIHYELLSRRAQLVFYSAWQIANMDRMLKRDIPLQ